jgi:hypothetical protein
VGDIPMIVEIMTSLIDKLHLVPAAFVAGVGPQLLKKWFPAGMDQAGLDQVVLKREELQLRREELAAQEQRFLLQIAEARKLKFDEIDRMREIRREEDDRRLQYQHWPLRGILPVDFLSASKARSGRALNVIITVLDTRDAEFYKKHGLVNAIIDLFHQQPAQAIRSVTPEFNGDLIAYFDILKSSRHSGDGLRATLWNLLQTEPTVLVEINVPTPYRLTFHVSHWGSAFEPNAPWVTCLPKDIDLPMFADAANLTPDRIGQAVAQAEAVLSIGLESLLVSLGDAYRTLHRPHEILPPILPSFLQKTSSALSPHIVKPMYTAYTSAYDNVAMHSPLLASELSARAATAAHNAGQSDFANLLLTKSLALNPLIKGATELTGTHLAGLRRLRYQGRSPLELEVALKLIRQVTLQETNTAKRDGTLEDFYRAIGKGPQGNKVL